MTQIQNFESQSAMFWLTSLTPFLTTLDIYYNADKLEAQQSEELR